MVVLPIDRVLTLRLPTCFPCFQRYLAGGAQYSENNLGIEVLGFFTSNENEDFNAFHGRNKVVSRDPM